MELEKKGDDEGVEQTFRDPIDEYKWFLNLQDDGT